MLRAWTKVSPEVQIKSLSVAQNRAKALAIKPQPVMVSPDTHHTRSQRLSTQARKARMLRASSKVISEHSSDRG